MDYWKVVILWINFCRSSASSKEKRAETPISALDVPRKSEPNLNKQTSLAMTFFINRGMPDLDHGPGYLARFYIRMFFVSLLRVWDQVDNGRTQFVWGFDRLGGNLRMCRLGVSDQWTTFFPSILRICVSRKNQQSSIMKQVSSALAFEHRLSLWFVLSAYGLFTQCF